MRKRANVLKKAAALFVILVGGVVFCCSRKPESVPEQDVRISEVSLRSMEEVLPEGGTSEEVSSDTASEADPGIWVYVCGAVRSPGVYNLASDARVFEAVDRAGGFAPDAREDAINLAEMMSDGERIFVPDGSEEGSFEEELLDGPRKVNINQADAQELMTLPGIGEAKAQAIISYRQEHRFESIEDIMNVSGIKESSFSKIRDLITT